MYSTHAMYSTREVLSLLRRANPGVKVNENTIRSAIRRKIIQAPRLFADRFAWTLCDIASLCRVYNLRAIPRSQKGD